MTKQEFMEKLKKLLKRLPHEEFEEAITYYEQYFEDGGEVKETPEQVARGILADFATDKTEEGKKEAKTSSKLWIIILSIFSIPVLLPIGACIFALAIAIFAVIFALLASFAAIIATGIAGVIASFFIIALSPATFLFFLGAGLITFALGYLLLKLSWLLAKKLTNWLLALLHKILGRVQK